MVTVILSDLSPLTEDESFETTLEDALSILRNMQQRITHIREMGTPDLEWGVGNYILEVQYESILMGAKLTLIS